MDALIRWSWTLGFAGSVLLAGAASGWFLTGRFDGPPTWMTATGGVLLLAYAALDRNRLGEAARTRTAAYGAGSALTVILAAGLAIATYALARTNDHTWDLTRSGSFTLSDQAVRVASKLEVDVTVTAFFRRTAPGRKAFVDQMGLFAEHSDRITLDVVDPLAEPSRARTAEITGDHGTVLFQAGDRTQRLDWEITEDEIVRALVLLQSAEDHRLCWSMGHGEPDPDDEFTPEGLGAIRVDLERLNYTVTPIRVAQEGIDRDCDALAIIRPTTDWHPYEREALAAYLAEGGRGVILIDPWQAPAFSADLERFGVKVGADEVRDANLKNQLLGVSDMGVVVLSEQDFATHPITRTLLAALVLPAARSVAFVDGTEGITGVELLRTSPEAWGETDPLAIPSQPDPGLEPIGEIPVMVAVEIADPSVLDIALPDADTPDEAPSEISPDALTGDPGRAVPADFTAAPGGRLVVVGDSDFASNGFAGWGNNRDLLLNTVAWLVEEEDQIGERPEQGDTLEITAFGEAMLCLISLVFVPGAAVAIAFATLMRRRYL